MIIRQTVEARPPWSRLPGGGCPRTEGSVIIGVGVSLTSRGTGAHRLDPVTKMPLIALFFSSLAETAENEARIALPFSGPGRNAPLIASSNALPCKME